MQTLKIVPDGWPCTLEECPPGFFVCEKQLCFKTEYGQNECYNSAGETFCGEKTEYVQPVVAEWQNEE